MQEFSDKKQITPYSLSQNQVLSSSTKQQKIMLALVFCNTQCRILVSVHAL